jgi:hypothetical protein
MCNMIILEYKVSRPHPHMLSTSSVVESALFLFLAGIQRGQTKERRGVRRRSDEAMGK